jgi:hypothetical protein
MHAHACAQTRTPTQRTKYATEMVLGYKEWEDEERRICIL